MAGRVAIVGGGIVGRTLAVALKAQSAVDVVLVAGPEGGADERASAVAASARTMFARIGVWPGMADAAQPVTGMVVTDSADGDVLRPQVLTFDGAPDGSPFAHMVPNGAILAALRERCAALGVEERAASARIFDEAVAGVTLRLGDGTRLPAEVIAAADGRGSRMRTIAGIGVVEKDFGQAGIAGTVRHELPHGGLATQHFLPAGPFAMLPLTGRRSSIVWTVRPEFAHAFAAMDPLLQALEIERAFGLSLGRITVDGAMQVYPLTQLVARRFAAGRVALLGDAAHVIHPLAGQGLNLGLRDAAALAEVLAEAGGLGEDLALALPRYERRRRADTVQMAAVTDALNALFSRRSDLLRAVRSVGLGLVERRERLKGLFIREAAGLEGELPRLMKGEAL